MLACYYIYLVLISKYSRTYYTIYQIKLNIKRIHNILILNLDMIFHTKNIIILYFKDLTLMNCETND